MIQVGDLVRVYPYIPDSPYYGWHVTGRIALLADGLSMCIAFDAGQPQFCLAAQPCWVRVGESDWIFVDGIEGKWAQQARPGSRTCVILLQVHRRNIASAEIFIPRGRRVMVAELRLRETATKVINFVRCERLMVTICMVYCDEKNLSDKAFETLSRIAGTIGRAKEIGHAT